MSQVQRKIARSNEMLRELDPYFEHADGIHPVFQWQWSEDMHSLVPAYTSDGDVVYEYRCQCGIDVQVHSATCKGTIAKTKLVRVPMFGLEGEFQSYANCWVLCNWAAPPPKSDWIDMMGTDEDYPAGGRYVPVHRGLACMVIPPKAQPSEYEPATRLVISQIKQHVAEWRGDMARAVAKSRRLDLPIEDEKGNVVREPDKDSPFWQYVDAAKEKMLKFNPDGMVGYTKEIRNA